MSREPTPEAQMMKLLLETGEEMRGHSVVYPGINRAISALNMARNMISELDSELRMLKKLRADQLRLNTDEALEEFDKFVRLI